MADFVSYRLRELRSNPQGRAATDDERRRLFNASLQQFEEMIDAAQTVTAATRPLPLYYALTQGGRAIAAAHADDLPPPSHGLRLVPGDPTNLLTACVQPSGDGELQAIAAITQSDALSGEVELGALWASLPELMDTPPLPRDRWPRALWVEFDDSATSSHRDVRARVTFEKRPQSRQEVADALAPYPSVGDDWDLPLGFGLLADPRGEINESVLLSWPSSSRLTGALIFGKIAPPYRFRNAHYLRPTVGASADFLTPLMGWWALMYAFSMFARYRPAEWVAALEVSSSPIAVRIEYALDEALTAIPHLVLEAIYAEPILLPVR